MLGDEPIEPHSGESQQLTVGDRGDVAGARLLRDERHLADRLSGPDLAYARLGGVVAHYKGAKPAVHQEVDAVAGGALFDEKAPSGHRDPLDFALELPQRGLVEAADLFAEHPHDDRRFGAI